ncbi:MAG: hypothetical protein Nk1A_1250 [Endomicrobiia bacterium]|nr:MAG: hypothetical protein Nk1A_1250 [Endomicrobiia bacterium]
MAKIIFVEEKLNFDIIGQSAYKIASVAGIKVPLDIKILVGEVSQISLEEEFAHEKLSPV